MYWKIYAIALESLHNFVNFFPVCKISQSICENVHSISKWSFPLRISSVNVTKSTVSCGNSCSRVFLQRALKHFAKSPSLMLEYLLNNASSYMTKTVNTVICEEFFEIFCTTCFRLLLRIRLVSYLRIIIKATFLL